MLEALATARLHMTAALQLLDAVEAPGEIGATLDLAIVRLSEEMARNPRVKTIRRH